MPAENIIERAFSGGEITPAMYARVDQSKYQAGLRTCRNRIVMRHGGASQRPGTMYVGTTLNGSATVRLLPFIYNETGLGQSYVLEFGNEYIAFYQNGGVVLSGGVPYTIVSPYLQGDLSTLELAQCADIITIVHPNYSPMELSRQGPTNWNLLPIVIGPIMPAPTSPAATGGNGGLPKPYYVVTAISKTTTEESLVSSAFQPTTGGPDTTHAVTITFIGSSNASYYRIYRTIGATADVYGYVATTTTLGWTDIGSTPDFTNQPPIQFNPFSPISSPTVLSQNNLGIVAGHQITYSYALTAVLSSGETAPTYGLSTTNLTAPSGGYVISFTWGTVPGATSYNIYRNNGSGGLVYGLMANTAALTFSDNGSLSPNFSTTPPTTGATANNPSTVNYVQQRRAFANTPMNPVGFWMSQSGLYSNFNTHVLTSDSDAVYGSLSGSEVNAIQHIIELKFMLMLTSGSELYMQGDGNGIITPSQINASTQSQYGCSPLRPLKVGDVLLFNQALGSFIRDFVFDFVIDGYRGNDVTLFSSHLFEGYQIVDWAFQKVPDSIVWVVRSDGVLLSCTYLREQQILAWSRHDFVNGFVENVSCIPENGNYAVYVVVRRVINGSTVRYIERLSQRLWTGPAGAITVGTANATGDPIDATYMDCFSSYDGRNTSATTMTLTASGGFQSGTNTEYQQSLTLVSSASFFNSGMVGGEIFLEDALFVSSQGSQGNQIRLTIQSYQSATQVTVTPNRAVPTEFQGVATTLWVHAVKTLSGLGYLQGQNVSVWADRFVVGSPLNITIPTIYNVSAGGSITLDKCYGVIYVGLPMTSDLETLAIDTSMGDSIMGETKNISQVIVYLYQTRGFMAGTRNPDTDPDNVNNQTGVVTDPLFNLTEQKAQANRQTYDAPPNLQTESGFTSVECNWTEEGRIFIRNVDPVPQTILAVIPAGLTSAKMAWSQRV